MKWDIFGVRRRREEREKAAREQRRRLTDRMFGNSLLADAQQVVADAVRELEALPPGMSPGEATRRSRALLDKAARVDEDVARIEDAALRRELRECARHLRRLADQLHPTVATVEPGASLFPVRRSAEQNAQMVRRLMEGTRRGRAVTSALDLDGVDGPFTPTRASTPPVYAEGSSPTGDGSTGGGGGE